jgi:hypothetical protein
VDTIKWNHSNSKYEIHTTLLTSIEMKDLLMHCIEVRNKINTVISTESHRGPSLHRVFPRTLSVVLRAVWDQLIVEAVPDAAEVTADQFDQRLKEFIAAHATAEDRYDLVQQLRTARKPRTITVQALWYRLREINTYVDWLPGAEPPLTEPQQKQAFYDAMPSKWQERFISAGNSIAALTMAQMVRYFRQQETLAIKREQENSQHQKKDASVRKRTSTGAPKFNGSRKPKDRRSSSTVQQRTTNNSNNRDAKRSRPNPTAGYETNMAESPQENTETAVAAVNDFDMIDMNAGTFECNCIVDNQGTSHHLDSLSFPALQNESLQREFAYSETFVHLCDEAYETGIDEITLNMPSDLNSSLRLRAISVATVESVQNTPSKRPLRVLFDSGSDKTLWNRQSLPKGAMPHSIKNGGSRVTGVHGTECLNQEVLFQGLSFPEFSSTTRVPGPIRATVFDNKDSNYDIILGLDLMILLGIDVKSSTKTVEWQGNVIAFKPANYFGQNFDRSSFESNLSSFTDDPLIAKGATQAGYKSKDILHSKYEAVNTNEVAAQQTHLSASQRQDLAKLFTSFSKLFSGRLGCYPHRKVHLELKEGAVPKACRPYPVPRHHRQVFKDELDRLCELGVLSKCGASAWLFPTFLIPKKDGRVRWITDFRELNKVIKRKVYNLPRIQDILTKRSGYSFFSKLDISMQYYTFELDEFSKNVCAICTPFGNYRYNRLGMGINQSPDVAQAVNQVNRYER